MGRRARDFNFFFRVGGRTAAAAAAGTVRSHCFERAFEKYTRTRCDAGLTARGALSDAR